MAHQLFHAHSQVVELRSRQGRYTLIAVRIGEYRHNQQEHLEADIFTKETD
jgi:hypothetical protein